MKPLRSTLLRLVRWPLRFSNIEHFLRKLTTGKPYGAFVTKIPPKHVHYIYPCERTSETNGIVFKLDLSDLMGWYVFWGFQDPARSCLYSLVQAGDTIFDIGANLGEVSLNAAKRAAASGRVFAFEPFPQSFLRLQENLKLNSFSNISAENLALGAEQGVLNMIAPLDGNTGMNRIATPVDGTEEFVRVQVTTLDRFVNDRAVNKIDLIKIDVEGFEMNVLKGAVESIERFRPKIFTEVIDTYLKDQGSSAQELIEFIYEREYSMSHASTGASIDPNNVPGEFQFDVVAIPREFDDKASGKRS